MHGSVVMSGNMLPNGAGNMLPNGATRNIQQGQYDG
jgi:hypothetical protein